MLLNNEGAQLVNRLDEFLDLKEMRSYAFKTGYYMGHLMHLAETVPEVRAYISDIIKKYEKESI